MRGSGQYGIVTGYGGHGIGSRMHMDPHVLNYGPPGQGPRLVPGMVLAIEPMVTLGSPNSRELDDGWTVVTADGSLAAHWEHTVAILADGPWVLTAEDGGRAELQMRGVHTVRSRRLSGGLANRPEARYSGIWRQPPFTHACCGRGSVRLDPRDDAGEFEPAKQ